MARTVEVLLVEIVEDREKVVMLALRLERNGTRATTRQTCTVRLDVIADDLARARIAMHDVTNERAHDARRRIEKHVVDSRVEHSTLEGVADDRVPVVRDGEDHDPVRT